MADFLGYSPDDLLGRPFWELMHIEDRERARASYDSRLAGDIKAREYRFIRSDGSIVWLNFTGSPMYHEDGTLTGILGMCTDVTDRIQAQTQLREAKEQLRATLEHASDALFIADHSGRFIDVNNQTCVLLGYDREELLAMSVPDLHRPEVMPRLKSVISSLAEGNIEVGEWELLKKNGEWIPVEISTRLLPDGRWQAFARDITDRKRSEAALRESRERLQAALDASATGTFRWNIRTNSLDWDRNLDRLFGLPPGRTARSLENFIALVHPDDRAGVVSRCENCARFGVDFDMEFRVVWPDGSIHWLLDKGKTFRDENGEPVYMTGACVDITDRMLQQIALNNTNEALQRSNRELEEFAFVASHDLQEPLRTIAAHSQLLVRKAKGQLGSEGDTLARHIESSVVRMERLIRDLIGFSRVVHVDAPVGSADANECVQEALGLLERAVESSSAQVVIEPLPKVRIDRHHLTQVLQNLISNALKYRKSSETPRVHLTVRRTGVLWEFSVSDNGIGFDPIYAERIFGLFKRLHGRDSGYEGTGIGLAICKRIVESAGGRIWAASEPERGSTFFFTLPAAD